MLVLQTQTLHLCDRSCRYVAPEFQCDFANLFTSRYDLTYIATLLLDVSRMPLTRGRGSNPNKMSFDSGADPSRVTVIQLGLGNVTTLDETPPEFTHLSIQDPTAFNDQIHVSFALNEPGTTYCRATRSDSGEVEQDMHIPWIQTAGWSNVHDGSAVPSSIVISKIENFNALGTNRINAPIEEALPSFIMFHHVSSFITLLVHSKLFFF